MTFPDQSSPAQPIERVADYKGMLRRAARSVTKLERKITRLRVAGDDRRAAQHERLLLRSHGFRLIATQVAAIKLRKLRRRNLRHPEGFDPGPTTLEVLRTARHPPLRTGQGDSGQGARPEAHR